MEAGSVWFLIAFRRVSDTEMHSNNFSMAWNSMYGTNTHSRTLREHELNRFNEMKKRIKKIERNRNVMKRNAHSGLFIFVGNKHQRSFTCTHINALLWSLSLSFSPAHCYFFIFHSIAFSFYFRVVVFSSSSASSSIFPFYIMCTCIYVAWAHHRSHSRSSNPHMFSPFQTLLFHYTAKPENNFENYVHVALK